MSAREEILGRIGAALRDVPADERPEDVPVAREYRRGQSARAVPLIELFEGRLVDYHATVRRVQPGELAEAIASGCEQFSLRRVAVPSGLTADWRPEGLEVLEDEHLDGRGLDEVDGAITGCAVAVAETGTLVLDGQGASGRRALTLVPDHHICIVRAAQIVGSVPEAMAAVGEAVAEQHVPITLISGPSASSDIELSRVEGVHGPRHLLVLIVD